jgi:ribosomal protein S18 acetylase RimI-like enzyme
MLARSLAITRRAVRPADDELLRSLFAESRPEFALLPADLLDLQVRAQRAQYQANHPHAHHEIVVADGADVGQLILDDALDAVRVVDVTIRSDRRGQGIGSAVLRDVISAAATRAVRLSVWSGNADAQRFYDRLGFVGTDHESAHGYLEMHHLQNHGGS